MTKDEAIAHAARLQRANTPEEFKDAFGVFCRACIELAAARGGDPVEPIAEFVTGMFIAIGVWEGAAMPASPDEIADLRARINNQGGEVL